MTIVVHDFAHQIVILGVTEDDEAAYDGFNFPRIETLTVLGTTHNDRLVMLSKEDPRELQHASNLSCPLCSASKTGHWQPNWA